MHLITDLLKKSQAQYFATIGVDKKPKVRPFQFMLEDNGKLFFCTSNQKQVYREIVENPNIELCASGENYSWLRLNGKVVFSKDIHIKGKVIESNPIVKSIYKTVDNPAFEIFYLDEVTATVSDFSGKPPVVHKL